MNNIHQNNTDNFLAEVNAEENLTKTKVAEFAAKLIQLNTDGHVDTLTALARLEFLSQIIDQVKTSYRSAAVDELELYGPEAKTGVTRFGVTFKQKETAVKYDFSQTPMWNQMEAEIESVKTAQKALESQLKGLTKSMSLLDESTGEINVMNPAIKSSKTTVEITLAK
jgi:hypothetical protein